MCFSFNPSQCHFPTLMPQPQYCTGRYGLCPCLDQGHNLNTAKARGTECPFCPVTAVIKVMVTPHVLERTLDSAKYKLYSSIQMLLWLSHILSFCLPHIIYPSLTTSIQIQLPYKKGCSSSWMLSHSPIEFHCWLWKFCSFFISSGFIVLSWSSLFHGPLGKTSYANLYFACLSGNRDPCLHSFGNNEFCTHTAFSLIPTMAN